jgi:phospholipid-binding lipoprotein MlaA
VLVAAALLSGCSTLREARGGPGQRLDPWENWNRKVFAFNEGLDENLIKPVATVYSNVVPQLVRQGVDNFFGNVSDVWSAINSFLQGKIVLGFQDSIRVGTNTVFGVFGLFDVASELGIERQREDFGQTLGRWGVGAGAYVVWPLLGPSTVRDSFALPLDTAASPALLFDDGSIKYSIIGLQLINTRANLLGATRMLDDIALDKYSFVRDAYLQRRRSLILDGEEPPEPPAAPADAASAPPGK